jgi:nucleoside-diphosphate-sugar epimerase
MDKINIFGKGFIGSRFCEIVGDTVVNDRNDYEAKTNNILYFISTIDNYNVYSDPFLDIDTNLNILIKVLESCKNKKDIIFNYISSWFVYGNTPLPAKESSYCDPKGFYSITKRTAEQLLISYCETFGIKYRIMRLANVLGPQDKKVSRKKNALQYMIGRVINGEDIQLYDNGDIYRDYIYVDDAVEAINLVITKGEIDEVYNIGNGEGIFIGDVMKYVREKSKSGSNFENIKPSEFHDIVQVKNMILDISKIKNLGYEKKYDIYTILDILMEKR